MSRITIYEAVCFILGVGFLLAAFVTDRPDLQTGAIFAALAFLTVWAFIFMFGHDK